MHTDQSLHALLSPLGATTFRERDGGGLSHLLGQGLRRRGTRRHLRAEAPDASQIDAIGVDEIQYAEEFALAAAQTRRESEDGTTLPVARSAPLQPEDRYVLTFLRNLFSSSGITTRPHGPESSSMTGVGK